MRLSVTFGCALTGLLAAGSALAAPVTLQDALVTAYYKNPTLLAERANLRATDEGVPQALAGWRPTVSVTGSAGVAGDKEVDLGTLTRGHRNLNSAGVTLDQPLFSGGGTRANVHKAKNDVYAERAKLMSTEAQVFTSVISDFVTVIQDQQLLALDKNNQQVLEIQLKATSDRYRVGELTQTDVSQAQAAVEGAKAQVATAEGNLSAALAQYEHDVGAPAGDLEAPAALKLNFTGSDDVSSLARKNNANVINAQFALASAQDNVDVQFAALLPKISAEISATHGYQNSQPGLSMDTAEAVLNLTVPLYQGGAEYSLVREAKQKVQQAEAALADARAASVASAVQAYETLVANQAAADSDRAQISADQVALQGVEREALIGTRTTLDVLNAEQALLQARTALVQNLAQAVASSYGVAAAVGQLTARDLALNVPLYDETAYYDSVDTKLWGVSVPGPNGGKR